MFSKASLLFLGLVVGAASLPANYASANSLGGAGGISGRTDGIVHNTATSTSAAAQQKAAQQKKAAALKKKQQQQQAAAAAAAKAKKEQQKKEWYANDRDRGLDVASEYAPKQIAKLRKNNTIAKGDTVNTGNGKKGWQQYMDKYYSR